jgi:proton-translocating NADH-quinone oxidoreductase chain N
LDTVNRYVAFRTTILTEIGNMLMLRIFALKKDVTLAELFLPVWVIETYIYEISTFFAYTLFLVKNFSPILGYLFNPIALGFLLIIIGLLFKIGAAPFHMWLPDVYEGAPNVVMAYFAITPKIMILTLLIRLCSLSTVFIYCQQLLIISAFLSLSFGTIMSIYQYNLKRFLAYSTLTHLGYMLLALLSNTTIGIQFLIFYMFSYTIMNIALFSILLSLNNKIQLKRNDYLTNLIGLGYSNKILAISLTIVLLSFAGIPPFIGFYSKYYIFLITMAAGKPFLAMIALVASILASVYYVRIIKMLFFEKSYKLGYYTAMPTSSAMLLVLSLYIIILFWYDQSFFFLWLYQLGINRP